MKVEDIKKVLVAGAGTMGQQISLLFAAHGYEIVLYDISETVLQTAYQRIKKNADRLIEAGKYSKETMEAALSKISISWKPEDAKNVDLINESVPEDPKLKGQIFAMFNKVCKPETIFTTNTSSLVPSMFAQESGRPERLCALHFHDMAITNIVDVMPHAGTKPEIITLVAEFAERNGQVPIILKKEHNGYVFNNMLMAFLASALTLAQKEVASIPQIDKAWTGIMNSPFGPFVIMDSIGLETVWKITDYWAKARDDKQAKANAAFLKTYIDAGKIGIKSGEGFYNYK